MSRDLIRVRDRDRGDNRDSDDDDDSRRSRRSGSSDRLKEGALVEARYRGRSRYYPGKITRERRDGTFDIDYDDGEKETGVSRDLIRVRDRDRDRDHGHGRDSDDEADMSRFFRGDDVEARWRPTRRGAAASVTDEWYPAEVLASHADGTFTVCWPHQTWGLTFHLRP